MDTGDPFQALPTAATPSSTTYQEAAENLFTAHYITYACISAYADAIASLPLKVYRKTKETTGRWSQRAIW